MKEINKESQVESELLDELLMGETIIYNTDDEQHEITLMGVIRKDQFNTNVIVGKELVFDYDTKVIKRKGYVLVSDDYSALHSHIEKNYEDEPTGIYEANINEDNYFAWWIK